MTLHRYLVVLPIVFFEMAGAQEHSGSHVPAVYSNIKMDEHGDFFLLHNNRKIPEKKSHAPWGLEKLYGNPQGTETGIAFDFQAKFDGFLHFGFVPYNDSRHPLPVYFHTPAKISDGKTHIDILHRLTGIFDMVHWHKTGRGTLGYRVIDSHGSLLYDGRVTFEGMGPFKIVPSIIAGPFVNMLSPDGATISFKTNRKVRAEVRVTERIFRSPEPAFDHEIRIDKLVPDRAYTYQVIVPKHEQQYTFRTAPQAGSRSDFVFSYCSDSRAGRGGGERDIHGTNAYMMKRIMSLNMMKKVAFCQFTGDLINGYLGDDQQMQLQYGNWKRAVEPYAHYFPIVVGMGNHESYRMLFEDRDAGISYSIDHFPFATQSSEALFASNFVNPRNGPDSEDGAVYDPDPEEVDFPSYKENVFYYTYDNVAMIVLNSDYFYAPSKTGIPFTGGGLHGYIMDNQLEWLSKTVTKLENDSHIDHIFVTVHTPFFPNGGHVHDDMWYHGDNSRRTHVAGKPLLKGILERRDELLQILVNDSRKPIALLTGDEHNYNRLTLTPETEIYPADYAGSRIKLKRTIYQVNNGAAGAPYYAQEQTPWTPFVSGFTTQNALVFFHVHGKKLSVEVLNPDTLEEIERYDLR